VRGAQGSSHVGWPLIKQVMVVFCASFWRSDTIQPHRVKTPWCMSLVSSVPMLVESASWLGVGCDECRLLHFLPFHFVLNIVAILLKLIQHVH
jgi:hypothetical protein